MEKVDSETFLRWQMAAREVAMAQERSQLLSELIRRVYKLEDGDTLSNDGTIMRKKKEGG
jgi:hypothetical protein